jgi:phosphoenolpyruvate-protein kinase (PTS system EI component)
MMYPMISGVDELKQANADPEECKGIAAQQYTFDNDIEVGVI